LVVEDNKTNQIIAKSILEEVRIEVSLSENGEEGVNYFRLHPNEIDLILMDLHMPILNGYLEIEQLHLTFNQMSYKY